MKLESAKHKSIRAMLAGAGYPKGLGPREADQIRHRLTVLETSDHLQQVADAFPGWRLHPMKGAWAGWWSIDVTGNFRLVFRMDREGIITELDYLDTH